MSKKNKQDQVSHSSVPAHSNGSAHAAEYRIIKHDLIRVIYLNAIYLAAVLLVYFTNSKTHYLENWFGRLFHF